MRVLLDTHVFLWWIADDPQISRTAHDVIQNGSNDLFLSAASAWEMAIKAQIGRLKLPKRPGVFVPEQLARNAITHLPIQLGHALHVFTLPRHHRDPFDRMIIAQAQLEKLSILSSDSQFAKYAVDVVW